MLFANKKFNRKIKIGFISLTSLIIIFSMSNQTLAASSDLRPLDKIVAVVNSEIITESELDTNANRMKTQMAQSNMPIPDDNKFRKQVIEQLINQKIELQLAKTNQITATEDQVTQRIQTILQKQHMTQDQLHNAVQAMGMSWDEFLKQMHDQVTITQFLQKALAGTVTVNNSEINDFLKKYQNQNPSAKQFHLIDVVVALPNSGTPTQIQQTQQEATAMMQTMKQNNDLQKVVAGKNDVQYSDMGLQSANTLPDLFLSHLSTAKPGDIIGPLQAPNGFHILKVVEVNSGQLTKDVAREYIFQQKMQKSFAAWIQKARQQADIRILDNSLKN